MIASWVIGWIITGWLNVRNYDRSYSMIKSYPSERFGAFLLGMFWPISLPIWIIFKRW